MKSEWRITLLVLVVGAVSVSAHADTVIDTTQSWNGIAFLGPFGSPNTETSGQIVTVPSDGDSVLKSFTFYCDQSPSLVFRGEVYAWDALHGRATGPSLYESPPTSTSQGTAFEPVTFDTGGIQLVPGAQYVIFGSSSKDDDGVGGGRWGEVSVNPNPYSGGNEVFLNNGTDSSLWTTAGWTQASTSLAFKADFVPEPLGLGCIALMATCLRRRRAR